VNYVVSLSNQAVGKSLNWPPTYHPYLRFSVIRWNITTWGKINISTEREDSPGLERSQ